MKGITSWNFTPYVEMHKKERGMAPYICRIAPFEGGFSVNFIDNGGKSAAHQYTLFYRKRGVGEFEPVEADGGNITLSGLDDKTDYEFYIQRDDGANSSVRLVRTGFIPGVVINYVHPQDTEYWFSGWYPCSPSLVRLPDGRLLASMDLYKSSHPQNLTMIFASDDNGASWKYLTDLFPCFWGKLFLHRGELYMMGVSREYGDVLIGKSADRGENWSTPTVLFRGSNFSNHPGIHKAPQPFFIHNGLMMTDAQYGATQCGIMCDGVLSVPVDADIMDPANWTFSDLYKSPSDEAKADTDIPNGIEGNMLLTPNGELIIFMRYDRGKAQILGFDSAHPENAPTFREIADFPSTASRFEIFFDEPSNAYVSLVNYALDEPRTERNLLTLIYSKDLKEWNIAKHILDYRDDDPKKIGFQYVAFLIEGDDIIFESRTAFNGADTFHNSNCVTFHKIEHFRQYIR